MKHTGNIAGNFVDEAVGLSGHGLAKLGPGAAIGIGAGVQVGFMTAEIGYYGYQWAISKINSDQFKSKSIQAVVGTGSNILCSTIGAVIGSAFSPVLGTFIGGLIGAFASIPVNHFARKAVSR